MFTRMRKVHVVPMECQYLENYNKIFKTANCRDPKFLVLFVIRRKTVSTPGCQFKSFLIGAKMQEIGKI